MEITVKWQKPIQLTRNKKILINKDEIPESIEQRAGVYFFSRRFGNSYIPFYIGQTGNLRKRLRDHLNSATIVLVLPGINGNHEIIKKGARFFHYAYFKGKRGQQPDKCLSIVQKHLIRDAVRMKLPILNEQLTTIRTHTLFLEGSKIARGVYDTEIVVEQ